MANACSWTDPIRKDPRGPRLREDGPKNAGPLGWKTLHLLALDGKLSHGEALRFSDCISCMDCQRHFKQLLRRHPIPSADPSISFPITVLYHNEVNRRTNKPEVSLEDAYKIWDNVRTVPVGLVSPGVPQFSSVVLRA